MDALTRPAQLHLSNINNSALHRPCEDYYSAEILSSMLKVGPAIDNKHNGLIVLWGTFSASSNSNDSHENNALY